MLNRMLCAENISRTGHLWLCSGGTVQLTCAVREIAGGFELGARNGLPEMMLHLSLSEAGLAALLSRPVRHRARPYARLTSPPVKRTP